jgi:hypothetical protein
LVSLDTLVVLRVNRDWAGRLLIGPGINSRRVMADDAPSELLSRRHQMLPVLGEGDIARMRRFGDVRRFGRGEALFTVGRVPKSGATASAPRERL